MALRTLSKSGHFESLKVRGHTNKLLKTECLISSSFDTQIHRFALIFRAIALLSACTFESSFVRNFMKFLNVYREDSKLYLIVT